MPGNARHLLYISGTRPLPTASGSKEDDHLYPRHGLNTPGKRSPGGKFLEAIYNRDIAKRIVAELQNKGYDAELLVQESEDISLQERVRRTNELCQTLGKSNVILISIHVNAAGDGTRWHTATGWSCYTCKG